MFVQMLAHLTAMAKSAHYHLESYLTLLATGESITMAIKFIAEICIMSNEPMKLFAMV